MHSVQQQWDKKKTLKQNMSDLGLAYDANKVLPLPMAGPADKIHLPSLEDMTVEEAKKLPSVSSQKKKKWVEGQRLKHQLLTMVLNILPKYYRWCFYMELRHIAKYAILFVHMHGGGGRRGREGGGGRGRGRGRQTL